MYSLESAVKNKYIYIYIYFFFGFIVLLVLNRNLLNCFISTCFEPNGAQSKRCARFTVIICETLDIDMFYGYEYICRKTDACREKHTRSQTVWDKKY